MDNWNDAAAGAGAPPQMRACAGPRGCLAASGLNGLSLFLLFGALASCILLRELGKTSLVKEFGRASTCRTAGLTMSTGRGAAPQQHAPTGFDTSLIDFAALVAQAWVSESSDETMLGDYQCDPVDPRELDEVGLVNRGP